MNYKKPSVLRGTTRIGLWCVGTLIVSLILISAGGLGEASAQVIFLVLTFSTVVMVAPFVKGELGFKGWKSDLLSTLAPLSSCWVVTLFLCSDVSTLSSLAWFSSLIAGWFAAARILAHFKINPATRVIVLFIINTLFCTTPFWSTNLLNATSGEGKTTLVQWLVSANPILTASHEFFGNDPLSMPLMYMHRISRISDYTGAYSWGSLGDVALIGSATFILSALCALFFETKTSTMRLA